MSFSNLPVDNGIFILPVQGGFILKYHEYSFVAEFAPATPPGPYNIKVNNIGDAVAEKKQKINAFKEHTIVCESIEKLTKLVTEVMMAKKLVASKLGQESFGGNGGEPGMETKADVAQATQPSPAGMML